MDKTYKDDTISRQLSRLKKRKAKNNYIDHILGKDGLLSRHLENYELRPQQLAMTKMLQEGIENKKHTFIEAGTGTGKSFMYLIPAIKNAIKNGKRVAVCTHTINLQHQLLEKDLPILQEALKEKYPFSVAVLKGRTNYVCERKINDLMDEGEFDSKEELILFEEEVLEWIEKTKTGEKQESNEKVLSMWSKIRSDKHDCKGKKCAYEDSCYFKQARERHKTANIVILNHATFFTDLMLKNHLEVQGFLKNFDIVVFDEGHHAEDVVTNIFSDSVSYAGTIYLINELIRVAEKNKKDLSFSKETDDIIYKLKNIREHMKNFWSYIEKFMGNKKQFRLSGNSRILNIKELKKMMKLIEYTQKNCNRIKSIAVEKKTREKAESMSKRLISIESSFKGISTRKWKLDYAYWINKKDSSYNPVEFKAAPIKVDEFIGSMFKSIDTVVFTSATLTINKKFDILFERLGVKKEDTISEVVSAPFNYKKQATFYIPKDALSGKKASNNPEEYYNYTFKQIKTIAEETERGVFALFTSYKALESVYKKAEQKLTDHNLFRQGSKNRNKLLQDFKNKHNSILFGTYSFWEGIDVKGDDLGYVIIDKIPFEVPTEPLIEARREKYEEEGRNFFMEYYLPNAIIKLKQGFGRLIRTKSDYGSVILLDNRINTKRYGKVVKRSLPSAKFTRDFKDVLELEETAGGKVIPIDKKRLKIV